MGDFDPAAEEFIKIRNRHGLEMFVKLIVPEGAKRNVYLAHGLGNSHDAAGMRALTRAFINAGYRVIVWDATRSPNRSEGETNTASFYFYAQDLEDVVAWSQGQAWYRPEYMLGGHSLGGMAAGTFAAAHPGQVSGLVLLAPVVSGAKLRRRLPLPLRAWWRLRGELRPRYLGSNPYGWEFVRSGWNYNLLAEAPRLSMPVLIIGAGRDVLIPPRQLRRLFREIRHDNKRLEIVASARHGFDADWEMARVTGAVGEWLKD